MSRTDVHPIMPLLDRLQVAYPFMEGRLRAELAKACETQHPDDVIAVVDEWIRLEERPPLVASFVRRVREKRDERHRRMHPELEPVEDLFKQGFAYQTGGRKLPNWARAEMRQFGHKSPFLSDEEDPGADGSDAKALAAYQQRGIDTTRTCTHPQDLDDGMQKFGDTWHNVRHPRSGWSCGAKCQRYERDCPGFLFNGERYERCRTCA